MVATAERRCLAFSGGKFSSYSLKYTKGLVDLCAEYPASGIEAALAHVC